jgi:hypothetical protein
MDNKRLNKQSINNQALATYKSINVSKLCGVFDLDHTLSNLTIHNILTFPLQNTFVQSFYFGQ